LLVCNDSAVRIGFEESADISWHVSNIY